MKKLSVMAVVALCFPALMAENIRLRDMRSSVNRADENDIHGTIPDVAVRADQALDRALGIIKADKTK